MADTQAPSVQVAPVGATALWKDMGDGTHAPQIVETGLGIIATYTHTQPSIGATTTAALASNTSRLYALFINDSDEVLYLKIGAVAVLNQGIRLNASGGSFEMSQKLGNLSTAAVNAISTSGSKVLLVTEGT